MVKLGYTEIMLRLNGETIWWSISVMCLYFPHLRESCLQGTSASVLYKSLDRLRL